MGRNPPAGILPASRPFGALARACARR